MNGDFTLDAAAHLVQTALTPAFLLSAIAALLNVFAGRLARVADRLDALTALDASHAKAAEIARLHRRSMALDVAVVMGTVAAGATCLAIMTLFVFALSNKTIGNVLVGFFGSAIVCTLVSVAAFGLEMIMASRGLRTRMAFHVPSLGWFRPRRD